MGTRRMLQVTINDDTKSAELELCEFTGSRWEHTAYASATLHARRAVGAGGTVWTVDPEDDASLKMIARALGDANCGAEEDILQIVNLIADASALPEGARTKKEEAA